MQHSRPRTFISEDGIPQPVKLFILSSTIIEHIKRVLTTTSRTSNLTMHAIEIMHVRTKLPSAGYQFRLKIEAPLAHLESEPSAEPTSSSVITTMCGCVNLDADTHDLGGLKVYLPAHRHSTVLIHAIFMELTEIPVVVELASDFLDHKTPIFMDNRGPLYLGVMNTVGSTTSRETHCEVHINAGPEIDIASRNAYTTQYIVLLMMVLQLCEDRLGLRARSTIIEGLSHLPEQIQAELPKRILNNKSLLIMGKGFQYPTCLEGALKIKEITCMHSKAISIYNFSGILAGELKHDPSPSLTRICPSLLITICNELRRVRLHVNFCDPCAEDGGLLAGNHYN
ncbi:hypothetical protein M422DRAFT_246167 [Sphaerobolus stellatus SS14]|nr:hypothetical protein M422DRAFT_246167 [Sphaerobolus stellatus SS14]